MSGHRRRTRARRASTSPCTRRCSRCWCTRRTATIRKIDTQYMPKLDAILKDIWRPPRRKTIEPDARREPPRPATRTRSQPRQPEDRRGGRQGLSALSRPAARADRRRPAHARPHDLRIADNTFDTVEASFELRNLMRDSSTSFEAIQKLEAPTVRADLQERGAAARVREPDPQARRPLRADAISSASLWPAVN